MLKSLLLLDNDDWPIKKTGTTTFAKQKLEDWTAIFDATKNVTITFGSAFNKIPLVQLTMSSTGTVPAYKSEITKINFKIKFQTNWTGEVDWVATERK